MHRVVIVVAERSTRSREQEGRRSRGNRSNKICTEKQQPQEADRRRNIAAQYKEQQEQYEWYVACSTISVIR